MLDFFVHILRQKCALTIWSEPVNLHRVETYEVLEVHDDGGETVELISQPEVRKPNMMKRGRRNTELQYRHGITYSFHF